MTSMSVWGHTYRVLLVLLGEGIFYSGVRPSLSAPITPAAAVPGAKVTPEIRGLCESIDYGPIGQSSASVPPTPQGKGKSILCIPCMSEPEVDEQASNVRNAVSSQQFLRDIDERYLLSRPRTANFIRKYDERRRKIPTFLAGIFEHLATAGRMSEEKVAAWVELFTYLSSRDEVNLAEIAGILYGFYSLSAQYVHQENSSRYIHCASSLLQYRVECIPDLQNAAKGTFIQEILVPRSGLSVGLGTYENLKDTVTYEDKLRGTFRFIEDGHYNTVINELDELRLLVRKDNSMFSAQSKTATIALLYHFSQLSDERLMEIREKANTVFIDLLNNQDELFPHDAALLGALRKSLG